MAVLTQKYPFDVRFIEEMPFNGAGSNYPHLEWNHHRILQHLRQAYPDLRSLPVEATATAKMYKIPDAIGKVGIIAAYSRTFCGTCNRIRLTPQGMLKTCLYDDGVFNVRKLIRAGATDQQLRDTFLSALSNRARDGWEAEHNRSTNTPVQESMSTIGG